MLEIQINLIQYLGCLTKLMVKEVTAEQFAADVKERLMDVGSTLVADAQAAVAVEPRDRPLAHPAVAAQLLARLGAAACDAPAATLRPAAADLRVGA